MVYGNVQPNYFINTGTTQDEIITPLHILTLLHCNINTCDGLSSMPAISLKSALSSECPHVSQGSELEVFC